LKNITKLSSISIPVLILYVTALVCGCYEQQYFKYFFIEIKLQYVDYQAVACTTIFIFCNLYKQSLSSYRKTSISPPWHSIFQLFLKSGVQIEVGALFFD